MIWHTITDYIFEENYVQKIKKTRKQVKKNDGETSNDWDASTAWLLRYGFRLETTFATAPVPPKIVKIHLMLQKWSKVIQK